jgi:hypothetical protein
MSTYDFCSGETIDVFKYVKYISKRELRSSNPYDDTKKYYYLKPFRNFYNELKDLTQYKGIPDTDTKNTPTFLELLDDLKKVVKQPSSKQYTNAKYEEMQRTVELLRSENLCLKHEIDTLKQQFADREEGLKLGKNDFFAADDIQSLFESAIKAAAELGPSAKQHNEMYAEVEYDVLHSSMNTDEYVGELYGINSVRSPT